MTDQTTRWYVPCGCDAHGDHLGCEDGCRALGCVHPYGMEVSAVTETEANERSGQPADDLYSRAQELLGVLEHAEALTREVRGAAGFLEICDRWNAWHDEWRTVSQWKSHSGRWRSYYQPMYLTPGDLRPELAIEDSEYTRLYFEEIDRDGDRTSGELPLEYLRDPGAWERERQAAGNLISRAEWEQRQEQQAREVESRTRAEMIEALKASGYSVTKTE